MDLVQEDVCDLGVVGQNIIAEARLAFADAAARARLNALFGNGGNAESPDGKERSSAERLLDQAEDLFKN